MSEPGSVPAAVPDRVDQFLADILVGPDALSRLLDGSGAGRSPLSGLRRPRIAFTGLGSSRYAALIVAAHLRATGATAWVEYPSPGAGSQPAVDLVLVAVSASGRTREVVDAATARHGRSLVVGVTNDPDSPLAAAADIVVPLVAGEETAGIACRTFRATVAALAILTGTPPADLRPAVAALAERIETRADRLPPIVEALDRAPSIDILADASLLGLAEQGALMLREGPRLPAVAYETGDWLHTGVYLALPGHRGVVHEGSPADDEVSATIERRGGRVIHVATAPGGAIERALVESVVAELVAAESWRTVRAL